MSTEFIESNILSNRIQSGLLILAMTVILALVGFVIGGPIGGGIAIAVCVMVVLVGPRVAPGVVLRMYRARPIPREASPQLVDLFHSLVNRAELTRVPTLHYVPSRTLNAFAVGTQENAAVAVTDGLLRILNPRELAGVLAHEISHIRNRDMRVLGIADSVSRLISMLSRFGQLMLLFALPVFLMTGSGWLLGIALLFVAAPMVSGLLQLALSRSREYNADLRAVSITGDPIGLASALQKLERAASGRFPWLPSGDRSETVPALLRTHPPTDERVKRIMEAGRSLGFEEPREEVSRTRLAPSQFARVHRGPRWHTTGLWY